MLPDSPIRLTVAERVRSASPVTAPLIATSLKPDEEPTARIESCQPLRLPVPSSDTLNWRRYSLVLDDAAKVDEADALFMFGACAAFISYLISKARINGLLR